jgi:hypothetical protein
MSPGQILLLYYLRPPDYVTEYIHFLELKEYPFFVDIFNKNVKNL